MTALGLGYEPECWQFEAWEMILGVVVLPEREVLLIRARGGSKTKDLVIMGLYLAYLGYKVLWFSAEASQMDQPKEYMEELVNGSFLFHCLKEMKKEGIWLEGRGVFRILNLTLGKARSQRADAVIFDEEARADGEAYSAAKYILSTSDLKLKIHASTPVKGTVFEENHDRLAEKGLVHARKYDEIVFLYDEAFYAEEKRNNPPWFFRQENECSFELPSGGVFRNVYTDVSAFPGHVVELMNMTIGEGGIYAGVDWNPVSGHWLVAGRWTADEKEFVVVDARAFAVGYDFELEDETFAALVPYFTEGNSLVVEDGGINVPYTKKLMAYKGRLQISGKRVKKLEWDSQGRKKTQCAMDLIPVNLYIDGARWPELADQIENAHWDVGKADPILYKDKVDSPHGLDSLLLATAPENRRTFRMHRV